MTSRGSEYSRYHPNHTGTSDHHLGPRAAAAATHQNLHRGTLTCGACRLARADGMLRAVSDRHCPEVCPVRASQHRVELPNALLSRSRAQPMSIDSAMRRRLMPIRKANRSGEPIELATLRARYACPRRARGLALRFTAHALVALKGRAFCCAVGVGLYLRCGT